jgi:amidohydrolase
MRTREQIKEAIARDVDAHRDELFGIGDTILRNPELGFKEFKTAALVAKQFAELGLPYREGLAITGVKARLSSGRPGPTVAIMGELDAVVVPGHPFADPATNAAHACGHNAQITSLLAAAGALVRSGAIDRLSGDLVFYAVPAEELVEIEYRMGLRREGKVEFFSGKQELIRLGEFDDVDMCILVHAGSDPASKRSSVDASFNGCVAKFIQYVGRAAHAGAMPHEGINALNAANIGLQAINAQRETFRDEDSVRVHPIITKGGDLVNVVPADVRVETFVRAKTLEAMVEVGAKVDRCLKAGAMAVGGGVNITTLPGYSPLTTYPRLQEIYKRNCLPLIGGDEFWTEGRHCAGSTDMGDMSLIMPTVQPNVGGVTGSGHGANYTIVDPELLYLSPAKAMAMTAVDLLFDGAREAIEVLESQKPRFTRDAYLAFLREMDRVEEYRS